MPDQGLSSEHLIAALGRELQKQSSLLAALLAAVEPHAWEYMLVQVEAQKDRWYEYYANGEKLVGLENKAIFQVLNTLGEQGWELVGMLPSGDFYFKRPVTD